jgi:SulP family sulfate permease
LLALWPRANRAIPAPLVVIVLSTVVVHSLDLPVATIGSRFGEFQGALPEPVLPRVTFADATRLVSPAFAIALLGAVESLLSAVVADGMIGSRHRSNAELVAQGIANIVSPIFGGIPATGAIARTATNVKSGGRTPVAGITHAVVLLLITLLFARWASLIPLAALAAILLMVAYHMSEWRSFIDEVRGPRADAAVLVTTFLLTVVVDLTLAIEVGMVLAAFLFMHRMAQVTNVTAITRELTDSNGTDEPSMLEDRAAIPSGVEVFEIRGAFFFGAAETFKDTIREVSRRPKVLIIRMRDVSLLDGTGLRVLRDLARRSTGEGTHLLLSELHAQPLVIIERSPLLAELGASAIHMTLEDALDRAVVLMQPTEPAMVGSAGRRV